MDQLRLENESHHNPVCQEGQHGWKPLIVEEEQGHHCASDGQERLCSHHPQSLHDETQTQPEHDPSNDRLCGHFLNPGDRSGESHQKPEEACKDPDPQIIPGVIVAAWEMAMPPIAFIGWTGIGVLK